jgi:hypothetical protein
VDAELRLQTAVLNPPVALPERKVIGPAAGIQELDFKGPVRDRT